MQQLSLPVPPGHVLRPAPDVWQLELVVVEPAHAPLLQAPVEHGHGALHCPFGPHVSMPVPEHLCVPGVQPPPSLPLLAPESTPLPDPESLPLLEPESVPLLESESTPPLLEPESVPLLDAESLLLPVPESVPLLESDPELLPLPSPPAVLASEDPSEWSSMPRSESHAAPARMVTPMSSVARVPDAEVEWVRIAAFTFSSGSTRP